MTSGRSAEQAQFAASLHDMLAAADVPGAARQWAAGDRTGGLVLWRKLAGAGVTALAVPERHGGPGASLLDLVVACEELGHHALPGPVAESVAAVPVLIAGLGDEALSSRWLPPLAAGDLIATVALPPAVPYAVDADVAGLVLLAGTGTVWLAEAGEAARSVDRTRSLFVTSGRRALARGPAAAGAAARAFEAGALASAAQLLGAGRALLEASVRHARQRVQFGRPIGAFQAVKHHLADVAIGLEFARPLLDAAALALDAAFAPGAGAGTAARAMGPGGLPPGPIVAPGGSGPWGPGVSPGDGGVLPRASRDVSAAKVACTDAARRAARAALQVHGAMGYTEEHDLHLWLLKVRALTGAWGTQSQHRARVMAAITQEPAWS